MDNIFDVYEGPHQFNDALYSATLHLEPSASRVHSSRTG